MATATAVPVPNLTPILLPSPFPAPEIHTLSIVKKNDAPIGIRMEQTKLPERKLIICGINEKSPLATSGAQVGQAIVTVNGCVTNSTKTAATLIRSTPVQGTVKLVTMDPTRSPLYKLVVLPAPAPTSIRWTSVRDGTLVRASRIFSSPSGLAEGDVLLAIQGRPVSTLEEAHKALQSAWANGDAVTSFYVLDYKLLRNSLWKVLVRNIRANRYKELVGDVVALRPIPDTFEDRPDVYGIFLNQRLKARVLFDKETFRMIDPWQYWSARYVNGRIEHDSAMDFHRNSYKKVLAVIREYNRMLEQNMRQLEEQVCQESWRFSVGSRAPIVVEFASVHEEREDGDPDDSIPLATVTYF